MSGGATAGRGARSGRPGRDAVALCGAFLILGASRLSAVSADEVAFFERRIRPVLAQECYECHRTGGKTKGGLALDHRAALLAGGESGPAVAPGRPEASLLVRVLRHAVEGLEMPKGRARLDENVIADFERWIQTGAADPRDRPATESEIEADTEWGAIMKRRMSWWSFQPIQNPDPPDAVHAAASDHPSIDFLKGV